MNIIPSTLLTQIKLLPLLILFFLFFASEVSMHAQERGSIIRGRVTEVNEGGILNGATVYLLQAVDSSKYYTAISKGNAGYIFRGIGPGKYIVLCTYSGYQPYYSSTVVVGSSSVLTVDIALKSAVNELAEVIVQKKNAITFDGNKLIINPKKYAGATTGTALDLLKVMPGIMVDNNENVSLNGRSDVTILINDRKRTMSAQQAAKFLKAIPSASVKQVELSDSKSAKNDAEGSGGIINIVTNKPLGDGYNADLYAGWTIDHYVSQTYSGTINLQRNKTNLFASAGYSNNVSYGRSNAAGVYDSKTALPTFNTDNSVFFSRNGAPFIDLSLDYNIDKKNIFGIAGSSYWGSARSNNALLSALTGARNYMTSNMSNADNRDNLSSFDVVYSYKNDSTDTKLKVDIGYLNGYERNRSLFENSYFDPSGSLTNGPFMIDAKVPLVGHQYLGQIDFEQKFGKNHLLQAGVKAASGQVSNNIRYDTLRNGSSYPDLSRSEDLMYEEKINAAYVSYRINLSHRMGFTTGMRYEHTLMRNTWANPRNSIDRSFSNFFPNFSITYNGNGFRSSLSYNRSITRPYYGYLNPYEKYINEFTSQVGNADLTPAFTNTVILANSIMDFLFVNLGYYSAADNIILYRQQLPGTTKTIIKPENALNYHALYMSVSSSFSLLKERWEGNINLYGFSYKSSVKPGFNVTDLDRRRLGRFVGSTSQSFKITKKFSIEGSYFYYGTYRVNQIEIKPRWQAGLGCRAKLLSSALTVSAFLSDIFRTMKEQRNRFYDTYESVTNNFANTQRFTLSVSLNIGKLKNSFDKSTLTKREVSRYREN